jgi:hypothetical protein
LNHQPAPKEGYHGSSEEEASEEENRSEETRSEKEIDRPSQDGEEALVLDQRTSRGAGTSSPRLFLLLKAMRFRCGIVDPTRRRIVPQLST